MRGAADALLVRCGTGACLLPIRHVRELVPPGPLFPLPGAPPEVLGLLNLRGEVLTVLCLERLLAACAPIAPIAPVPESASGRGEDGPSPSGDARPAALVAVAEARGMRFAVALPEVLGAVRQASAGGAGDGREPPLLDLARVAESVFELDTCNGGQTPRPHGAAG